MLRTTKNQERSHDNEKLVSAVVICRVHGDCLAGPLGTDVPKRRTHAIAGDRRISAGSADARRGCAGAGADDTTFPSRSEEHTSELQSQSNLVCRLLLEKKKLE